MKKTVPLLRFIFPAMYVFIIAACHAQDVTGKWQGVLKHTSCLNTRSFMKATLELRPSGDDFTGVVRFLDSNEDFSDSTAVSIWEFRIRGKLNGSQLTVRYGAFDEVFGRRFNYGYYILGSYTLLLTYSNNDGIEKLSGFYGSSAGARGNLFFTRGQKDSSAQISQDNSSLLAKLRARQKERKDMQQKQAVVSDTITVSDTSFLSQFSQEDNKADQLQLETEKLSKIALEKRQQDLQQTVNVKDTQYADIQIYDNAAVDNDTISLFADGQLLLHRIRVSAKPVTFRLYKSADKNYTLLQMVAENLGEIPPNTAILILHAGKQRREMVIRSDYTKNGTLLIKWE